MLRKTIWKMALPLEMFSWPLLHLTPLSGTAPRPSPPVGSAFPSTYHLPSPSLLALPDPAALPPCPFLCMNPLPSASVRLSLLVSNNLLGMLCWKVIIGTKRFVTEK